MSINSIAGQNVASPLGSFASSDRPLSNDAFSVVLSCIEPKDLACTAEAVCKSWKGFIDATDQWEKRFRSLSNLPKDVAVWCFLPMGCDCKKGALLASPKLFDSRLIEYYLPVKMGPIPSISHDEPLKRYNDLDPWLEQKKDCSYQGMIGESFTWIDIPEYYEITDPANYPYVLDKLDYSNDEDLPRLVPKKEGDLVSKEALKVPPTIHNIGVLFADPKKGNASAYSHISDSISNQLGNKRIPSGRVCMRDGVIAKAARDFPQQQATATHLKVVISPLGRRIIYNFLKHVSYGKANVYPDGKKPWIYARTSTLVTDSQGIAQPTGCGEADSSGLNVSYRKYGQDAIGVAVELPAEVQPIES